MDNSIFYCKSKRLADYMIKHGSKFIGNDNIEGKLVYLFENDESINDNIAKWESDTNRCMF